MCRSSLNKQLEHRGSVLGIFASPDAGTDWGQEEKGTTEHEMAGWHHRLDGREFVEMVMGREGWCAANHGVAKSWTLLSD